MKITIDQKGEILYHNARKMLAKMGGRIDYHFNVLINEGLLERVVRGNYRISPYHIQQLREYFGVLVPIVLVGGLGQDLTLLTDLSQALQKVSIVPKHRLIITSPEVASQLRNDTLIDHTRLEIISLDYQTALRGNPSKIKNQVQEWFLSNYLEYKIICDLTGGTKPVTIALLNLSQEYTWKTVYFSSKELIWL